jgi:hypothetical protein
MGMSRISTQRTRDRYAQALRAIPLPVRTLAGAAPAALVTVGETEIAGRRIEFAILPGSPRLWITVPDLLPPVIGYTSGFGSQRLDLHLTELDHIDWAAGPGRVAAIKRAAYHAWTSAQRDCEG